MIEHRTLSHFDLAQKTSNLKIAKAQETWMFSLKENDGAKVSISFWLNLKDF